MIKNWFVTKDGSAISSPGMGYIAGASFQERQLGAVMQVLSDHTENVAVGDLGTVPVIIMGDRVDALFGIRDGVRAETPFPEWDKAMGETGLDPQPESTATPARATGWLIHKASRGWYRPEAQGYTNDPAQAGRFTLEDAERYSHPNGETGPRDGISIKHESELQAGVDLGGNPLEAPDEKLQRQSRDLVLMLVDWFNLDPQNPQIEGAASVTYRRIKRLIS